MLVLRETVALKRRLNKYGFPKETVETVRPIIHKFENGYVEAGERRLAEFTLIVCQKIEEGLFSPKEADRCFLLIDLYIDDNSKRVDVGEDTRNLLFEGNILHDYGTEFGADLALMRTLAEKILQQSQS